MFIIPEKIITRMGVVILIITNDPNKMFKREIEALETKQYAKRPTGANFCHVWRRKIPSFSRKGTTTGTQK